MSVTRIASLAVSMLLVSAAWASASLVTYQYTGSDFTTATAPFTPSENITGVMVFSSALPGGLDDAAEIPVDYNFTDGVQSFTPTNSSANEYFRITTDAQGNIIDWGIELRDDDQSLNAIVVGKFASGGCALDICDLASLYTGAPNVIAYTPNSGSFTELSSPVPEPSTLVLIAIIAAMVARKRRESQ